MERVDASTTWTLSAGIRVDVNAVQLDVPRDGPLTTAQRSLVAEARQRFGGMLRVGSYAGTPSARACLYARCDPPLRAGVEIFPGGCTGGFLARSVVDSVLYMFTAGHCGSQTWQTMFRNGSVHTIGPVHNRQFNSGGDMEIIRVNKPADWHARAWVLVTAGQGHDGVPGTQYDEEYPITKTGGSVMNQRVCTAGAFWGQSNCGRVTGLGQTFTYAGVTVRNLGRASFCGTQGDSGAPVFNANTALGLQVAGPTACDSYYQGIVAAETAMRVRVSHDGG
jgi:hypothetical protein